MFPTFHIISRDSRAHHAFPRENSRLELLWLSIICLALLCTACGQSATVKITHQPAPSATTPAEIHCGAIGAAWGAHTTSDPHARQVEACFSIAYVRCDRADLVFTMFAVDVGTVHTFTLQPANKSCAVSDRAQGYSANFGGSHGPLRFYACAGLVQQGGGLLVRSCGAEGDVFIPAPK